MKDFSYNAVMSRSNEIMKEALGIDYSSFESGSASFDYEKMMREVGYSLDEIIAIQRSVGVGNTPLIELKNITELARKYSKECYGARIFIKDEASNPSGSFKARRASNAVYYAKSKGYKGVIAATSGNYGAAVASQAAMQGLKCIIIQECYDSVKKGQPEILEKARACEAYGAEVVQLSVGPELFYIFLKTLEETGFFNASLYTPFGIAGVETLGYEIVNEIREREGVDPTAIICTNAGGGNLTGTARGALKANALNTRIIGASVSLKGLHMGSDDHFNKKSFTTGHTGFGIPFATNPDRSDVPRSAARPLRYMDEYYTLNQGEVFYITEMLAQLEGLERGPAGCVSLAAAFSISQTMPSDEIIVVQETEYTGAGKHINAQLSFARDNGIDIFFGDPSLEVAGENIILPSSPSLIHAKKIDLNHTRHSFIKNVLEKHPVLSDSDIEYLVLETKSSKEFVLDYIKK